MPVKARLRRARQKVATFLERSGTFHPRVAPAEDRSELRRSLDRISKPLCDHLTSNKKNRS
jgi:hypothetical protein